MTNHLTRSALLAALATAGLGAGSVVLAAEGDASRSALVGQAAQTRTVPTLSKPPGKPGTVAYNRWLGRSFNGVLQNQKDPAKLKEITVRLVSPGYIQHNAIAPEGRDGLIAFLGAIGGSFPDSRIIVRDVTATKTKVISRWTFTGTLTGQPFLGVAAKGQKVEFDVIDIWTVRDGKLFEHWDQLDWTRAIAELTDDGKLPQPFLAAAQKPVDR